MPKTGVHTFVPLFFLRCEWNSSTCSLFTHTWLSSTYLNHHLGGFGAVKKVFSSTYSMTRSAKIVWNGHLGTRRSCCRGRTVEEQWYFGWISLFLSGSDWSKSSLSLTTSMASWVGMQVNSDTTSKDTREGVIVLVIFKSASCFALVRFLNNSRDYSLNCTPLGPITI